MARDKTDKTDRTPAATSGASALVWEKSKIAEDEISELWKKTAKIETDEQFSEAARETQLDRFWPFIEDFANRCDEVLQEHGFPCAKELVRHDKKGNWWRHPPEAPKRPPTGETWHFAWGYELAEQYAPDFSDPWYAGRIGFKCRSALEFFQKGDTGKPFLFDYVFEIASLRTDWRWRRRHKPAIITGRGVRKGGKLGGEMRAGKYKPDTAKIIEEMARLHRDGQTISRAAELTAKKGYGTSKGANLKLWTRHKSR